MHRESKAKQVSTLHFCSNLSWERPEKHTASSASFFTYGGCMSSCIRPGYHSSSSVRPPHHPVPRRLCLSPLPYCLPCSKYINPFPQPSHHVSSALRLISLSLRRLSLSALRTVRSSSIKLSSVSVRRMASSGKTGLA